MRKIFSMLVAGVLVCGLGVAPRAQALLITDVGIVGTVTMDTENQPANADNRTEWANYLIALAATAIITADGNTPLDGATEDYVRSAYAYTPVVFSVTDQFDTLEGSDLPNIEAYDYAFAKYDGKNAGYVLFNVSDYLGEYGGTTVPEFPASFWTTETGKYRISGVTLFTAGTTTNRVPDGGMTLALLGMGIMSVAFLRRRLG